jgi:hypothetical protein
MTAKINPFTGGMEISGLTHGVALAGLTNSDMTPSKTAIVCAQLSGYGDDYFNNHFYMQVLKGAHELLTLDVAPAPADFAAGATLTGATSLKTCVVVVKLTPTTYIVKSRTGAFTDGEIISDGTNSRDCAAGFPTITAGQAPEHEVRKITDYVAATGAFTVDAFTQVLEPLAEVMVIHESLVSLGRDDADNVFDSSAVTKNRDGSILERTEFIIDALMGTQFRTEQSKSGTVEENAFEMFNISLFDLDSGAILSADINIAAISQVMEKSTGGADFSSAGITQPVFAKADGRVYCSYQFLAAQWAVGDLYRLTVTGITAVVDTETVYCPTMVWSNAVLEAANIDTNVETILSELAGAAGVASFPGAANPGDGVSLAEVIRAILTSMVGGDDFDGYTNISGSANASLNAIAQKFAATLGIDAANTFSTTIHGANQATIEAAFDAVATYIVASGADFTKKVNNLTLRTNLEDIIQDICAVVGCDGTNAFSVTSQGAERTTILAAFESLAAYLSDSGAAFSATIDPGGTARTCVETAIEDVGKVLAGGGITTFPGAANPGDGVSLAAAIRAILTSLVGGDDFDGYTNISGSANASLNAIAQKFAATLGIDAANTFSTTIHGANQATIEAAFDAVATYIVASGADFTKKVNNLTLRTNLEDIIQDICAVVGCDGTNVFDPAMFAGSQTTIEAAFSALGTVIADIHSDLVTAASYIDTEIGTIITDTEKIYDAALGVSPADGSLASFIATGGTALGTRLPVNKSLYDGLAGGIDAVNRIAGKMQIKGTTIDLAQIAGAYDLFTGTTQDVVVEKLAFRLPNVNVADDATITSIAIASNDSTPQVMISAALGAKANLTAEAQIYWTGAVLLKAGKKIQLTIATGAADAATVCDVVAEYHAVTGGGYLA